MTLFIYEESIWGEHSDAEVDMSPLPPLVQ